MANTQVRISRILVRGATVALAALAAFGLLGVVAIPSAKAQSFSVLHSFTGFTGFDGSNPQGGLIMDQAGNLYGTTYLGGAHGVGTVFKLDTSGNETVLHSFTGAPDGALPTAGLIMDKEGNLYGTTISGGASNFGTVFKLDTSGNETVLHSFTGGSDGALPFAALIMDKKGNLYGTTWRGGVFSDPSGFGTVFKLTLPTPPPTITSISPTTAIAGGAAFSLTVNGKNFIGGSTVSFTVQMPQQAITNVTSTINNFGLPHGTATSLISKLNHALAAINSQNTALTSRTTTPDDTLMSTRCSRSGDDWPYEVIPRRGMRHFERARRERAA